MQQQGSDLCYLHLEDTCGEIRKIGIQKKDSKGILSQCFRLEIMKHKNCQESTIADMIVMHIIFKIKHKGCQN